MEWLTCPLRKKKYTRMSLWENQHSSRIKTTSIPGTLVVSWDIHIVYNDLSASSLTIIDSTYLLNASKQGCASHETILPKKVWSYSSPVSSLPTPPSPSPATSVATQTWPPLYLFFEELMNKVQSITDLFLKQLWLNYFCSEVKQGLSCITCSRNN